MDKLKLRLLVAFMLLFLSLIAQVKSPENSIIDGNYFSEEKPTKSIACFENSAISKVDTIYHHTGKIKSIIAYDSMTNHYCGVYNQFDSTGVLIVEGQYVAVDSVKCKDCYTDSYSGNRLEEKWTKMDYADVLELKVGVWKYLHPNGQLKMIGEYSDMVHSLSGMSYPLSWEGISWPSPVDGYIYFQQLKKGKWEYYDELGNNYLTEEYVNGTLVYKIERD
jgi:hypothetical protein